MATLTQILLDAMSGGDTELPDTALTDQIPTGKIFEAAPPKGVPSLPGSLQNFFKGQFEGIRSGEITEPGYTQDALMKSLEDARNRELQRYEIPTLEDPVHGYNVVDRALRSIGDIPIPPLTEMARPGFLSQAARYLPRAAAIGAGLYGGYKGAQYLTSPLDPVSPYPEGPDYIGNQATWDRLIDPYLEETRYAPQRYGAGRGGFLPDWVRGISPMSTAQAGSGFVPGKSVTVEVEQTPEEDFAITEALMQLDEPRIPFSLPPEARGVFTEEVQAPFILDQQVDPYTSITTLPIGEEVWTPTLSVSYTHLTLPTKRIV